MVRVRLLLVASLLVGANATVVSGASAAVWLAERQFALVEPLLRIESFEHGYGYAINADIAAPDHGVDGSTSDAALHRAMFVGGPEYEKMALGPSGG